MMANPVVPPPQNPALLYTPSALRACRLGPIPFVSVVVSSRAEGEELRSWLSRLESVRGEHDVEVVLVRRADAPPVDVMASESASLRVVAAPPEASTPGALHRIGMATADGDVVLLTDDGDARAAPRLRALLRAYDPPADAERPERLDAAPPSSPPVAADGRAPETGVAGFGAGADARGVVAR